MIRDLIKQTLNGKTVNRILMNQALKGFSVGGDILDLGGGNERSTYFAYLELRDAVRITSIDISPDRKPDIIANLEGPLPIADSSYDAAICINLLEHVYDHRNLVTEVRRVLRSGGTLHGYVPFLVRVHADPNDFFRYTEQGLHHVLHDAGYGEVQVQFIGRGPLTAAWAQCEFFLPPILRWPVTLCVFGLDRILTKLKPYFSSTYALGYVFNARQK